jgi:hypothetical protein
VWEHPASKERATKPTIDLRKRENAHTDGVATATMLNLQKNELALLTPADAESSEELTGKVFGRRA